MAEEQSNKKVRLPLRAKFSARRQYRQAAKVAGEAARLAETAEAKRVAAELHRTLSRDAMEAAHSLDNAAEATEHSAAARNATAERLREVAQNIELAGREHKLGAVRMQQEHAAARERRAAEQRAARERAAKEAAARMAGIEQEAQSSIRAATETRERSLTEVDAEIVARRVQVAEALEAYHVAILAEAEAMSQRAIMKKAHDHSVKNAQDQATQALKGARDAAAESSKKLERDHATELKNLKTNHDKAEREQKRSLRPRLAQARVQTVE